MAEIGLNTAIVPQQIHYWLTNEGIRRNIEGHALSLQHFTTTSAGATFSLLG